MLRITPQHVAGRLVLKLEGWLTGDWVSEVATSWRSAVAAGERRIWVDLSDVYLVDIPGRELLARMHRAGVGFMTRGCEMREVLREISGV